ncbi:uncharacterized protein LOC113146531 [Cyclospora cayetanensis]|uniref:Uncharacterized protein LOC113146531 n=1 Tax=Cyclospora cayetanensis TaxID=88456 RepID=A0A6P6RQ14_9EIME|nr:uncharacterized protein LOC113146531 [Cyclospora cayetanensis]
MARTRRSSVSAAHELSLPESHPDSQGFTGGRLTLNKAEPRVSVSAARVDRMGLHLSLTIPFDSSVAPKAGRNTCREAPKETTFSRQNPPTDPTTWRRTAYSKGSLLHPTGNVSAHSTRQASQKAKEAQANKGLLKTNGHGRTRAGTPMRTIEAGMPANTRSTPWTNGASPSHTATASLRETPYNLRERWTAVRGTKLHEEDLVSFPCVICSTRGKRARVRQVSASSLSESALSSPAMHHDTANGRAFSSTQMPARGLGSRKYSGTMLTKQIAGLYKLLQISQTLYAKQRHCRAGCRNDTSNGSMGARRHSSESPGYFAHPIVTQCFDFWKAGTGGLGASATKVISCPLRSYPKNAFWVGLTLLVSFWRGGSGWYFWLLAAVCSALLEPFNSVVLLEHGSHLTRGQFYLTESPEVLQQCSQLGRICIEATREVCGLPVDLPLHECIYLGHDVAARDSGGFVDYAQTSGSASQGTLALAQLLQGVASFVLPQLPSALIPVPPVHGTLESEGDTLLQSYFPLYNHTNDPGRLVSSTNAAYIIPDKTGQLGIALARRSSIFAIAMETPEAVKPEGECASPEVRHFSVYIQVDDEHRSMCPSSSRDTLHAKTHAKSRGRWCEVGSFEYRCSSVRALQVFCLHTPRPSSRPASPWTTTGSGVCRGTTGWQTERVFIVLKSNWGADATRVHRLRVLARPSPP